MAWNLAISEEQFDNLYPELLEYKHIFKTDFKSDKDFIENYLTSKLWRLNNLYTIIDKNGDRIPFVMNLSQHKVYSASLEHPRLIILKSRQQGISTFWLISFFDDAIFNDDLNIGLMAQGADEASTLLERVKFYWDTLDDNIKDFLGISNDKDNAKAFSFTNNSTMFIRTSFRSATLQRMHISELGKIANKYPEKAKETNTGTLQAVGAGNTVVIESTAEGNNMFKDKWDSAVNLNHVYAPKDFKPLFLSWLDDPDCRTTVRQDIAPKQREYFEKLEAELGIAITQPQRWFWVMQYRELGDDIYQEYPSTPEEAFSAVREGTYYARNYRQHVIKNSREKEDLYDPNLPVDVVMDLGMNDEFVLGFWQYFDGCDRLIHEYTNSGEGLEHYVNYINEQAAERGYDIGVTVVPHDINVKELGTGISRKARLRELGVRKLKVLPKLSIADGIEAVRKLIPKLWIDKECSYTRDCMLNYSKEWDEARQNWKNTPLHDKWSHGADMVRYRAISRPEYRVQTKSNVQKRTKVSYNRGMSID